MWNLKRFKDIWNIDVWVDLHNNNNDNNTTTNTTTNINMLILLSR